MRPAPPKATVAQTTDTGRHRNTGIQSEMPWVVTAHVATIKHVDK